jgi:hypothetical protein
MNENGIELTPFATKTVAFLLALFTSVVLLDFLNGGL